ncbi:MAG: glycosyltransferase family 2 protein [Phycisphaerae bacterium]|jgi:dolichol-phosphate mannosyltransferase
MSTSPEDTRTSPGPADAIRRPQLTIITPAYNESKNLPLLHERLQTVLGAAGVDWEWLVIDDHSRDGTFDVVSDLARRDPRVRGILFARNAGSHTAIMCGLHHAAGDAAVVMAADLQDPPETIPELLERWRGGARVVWAVRRQREGETASTVGFARLYYFLMRRVVGIRELPPTGADFFLIDRMVIEALRQFQESHVSLLVLLTWMGFPQDSIQYDKKSRAHGQSGWTLRKKLKLVVDSVTAFTYLPIRLMVYVGVLVAVLGFVYAGVLVVNALAGNPPQGWTSTMVTVLCLGGVQMLMMGVLGEYLWRTLDEARRRPRYLIEAVTGRFSPPPSGESATPPANQATPTVVSKPVDAVDPGGDFGNVLLRDRHTEPPRESHQLFNLPSSRRYG